VGCSVLQCVAIVLQCVAGDRSPRHRSQLCILCSQCVVFAAVCCSVLQCVSVVVAVSCTGGRSPPRRLQEGILIFLAGRLILL